LFSASFKHLAMAWQYPFDPDFVREHNPDVVIIQMLERALESDDFFGNTTKILAFMHGVVPSVSRAHRVGRNVVDTDSLLGSVRRADAGTPAGWLVFGGKQALQAGQYVARFRLRGDSHVKAELDVAAASGRQQLAHRLLSSADVTASDVWVHVDLPFEISGTDSLHVEPRVYYHGGGKLDVESVCLVPLD
jgi:hypothetical protein